ncbi:MAG: rod shape-determining protein MreD [Bacteroidetes bacterium]|jgi:rod shape-determining protein MreD|nr:rod shape-determining protein MreD [Bacteroidota bacterium]
MITKSLFTDILLIALLVALQIFVLNRIVILGKYTPVLYPIFVMFYPFFRNKFQFLALSFLLGLGIDAFLGTWGINAFATCTIAYFRTMIFRSSTDTSTDFFSFDSLLWTQFLGYIFSSIWIHQFFVQYLEFFKFNFKILEILLNITVTAVISFIFILLYALAFRVKQKI